MPRGLGGWLSWLRLWGAKLEPWNSCVLRVQGVQWCVAARWRWAVLVAWWLAWRGLFGVFQTSDRLSQKGGWKTPEEWYLRLSSALLHMYTCIHLHTWAHASISTHGHTHTKSIARLWKTGCFINCFFSSSVFFNWRPERANLTHKILLFLIRWDILIC